MSDFKPLPKLIEKMLESYGINPEDLQIAVKTAYENVKQKENNKNDL